MRRRHLHLGALVSLLFGSGTLVAQRDFVPDSVFKGSTLAGWRVLGPARWSAHDGELNAAAGEEGSWLVSDQKFQDVRSYARLRCQAACNAGILLRAELLPGGGLHGIYVSLAEGNLDTYDLKTDASGKETVRTKLGAPPPEVIGISGPPPSAQPSTSAPPRPPRQRRPVAALAKSGEWNTVELLIDNDALNGSVNDGALTGGATSAEGFGSIALFAGPQTQLTFDHVGFKDINREQQPPETTSSHFRRQKISDFYYGWSAVSADVRHTGSLDVISGPFYYAAPEYTERRRYREGRVYNPTLEYAPDMVNFAYDFNGDGWPDILASNIESGLRPIDLYVNPKGESRRWTKYRAIDKVSTELVLMKDIDGDGKPEIIFGGNGKYSYAKPDPNDISARWLITPVSAQLDRVNPHGMGVGDINGDGRMDLVVPNGWYEQPAKGQEGKPWTFHEGNFGNGGAEIGVYDVNGDGLNDVVTSMEAHGFGLAWFEQKRAADGAISFERHDIEGDFTTKNAGNVTFTQPHAAAFADMDGDGIPDMVVGKSLFHHLESWGDPDPYGDAVLYVYRVIRDPHAQGGATFVPELIDNRSGVGSAIQLVDLNHDGAQDVLTQSALGTFIFYGRPGRWSTPGVSTTGKTKK